MGEPITVEFGAVEFEVAGAAQAGHEAGAENKTSAAAVAHNGLLEQEWKTNHPSEQKTGEQKIAEQRITGAIGRDGGNTMTETAIATQAEPETESQTQGHELDALLGRAFESKPIWTDLYENLRDVFFPPKLPPLELTSKPIAVVDPMAVKANPWSFGTATAVNVAIIAFFIVLGLRKVIPAIVQPPVDTTPVDISDFKALAPKKSIAMGGGGGGGSHDLVDASKGKLPKFEKQPITPPMVPVIEHPKLAVESAIAVQPDVKIPDTNMPNIGVQNSTNVKLASNGQGGGGGMGTGTGGGLGPGNGNGYGPGSNGNYGGGVEHIGGGVSEPIPIFEPEAEFSDEARRAKYQGEVMVQIIVDALGHPQNAHVIRPIGMGLDEKAVEAAMKYKFKPAMKNGKPVPVYLTIAVNFRLY
jgi:periplasmic protein TonB